MRRPLAAFLIISILIVSSLPVYAAYGPIEKYGLHCNSTPGIPLEKTLWLAGDYPVEFVSIGNTYINWTEAAYRSLWSIPVREDNGSICAFGERLQGMITVGVSPKPEYTTMDIAATACEALGIPTEGFDGVSLTRAKASQVVVIYVDALGWYRYLWAREKMKNITSLGPPLLASSVFPSISNVNAAAMVTGVYPEKSGIDIWENRTMLVDNDFDLAKRYRISHAWVDGPRPPVSLKDGIIRTPYRNDSRYDEGIMEKAISEYRNGTRLLYVHIFEADQALHRTGPYSRESLKAIEHDDALVGHMLPEVGRGTLVIVVSDHGGHAIEGGKGDHGTLLPQDMLVPVFIKQY